MLGMLMFAGLQFINVVLGSLRSITTAKSGRHVAAAFNCVAFTWYAAVVFFTASYPLWFVLVCTAVTNIIGFYLADIIFCKMQKDKTWCILTQPINSVNCDNITNALKEYDILYTVAQDVNYNYQISIFSYSQKDSLAVRGVLHGVNPNLKYFVSEMTKTL